MLEQQYLKEISKHHSNMVQASMQSKEYRASMLLTESYIILYNALPGPHEQLSFKHINNTQAIEHG